MIWLIQFLLSPLPTPALVGLITFGASVFLWVITRPKPLLAPINLKKQSIGIQNGLTNLTFFTENGPCLGYRKPKQPYQWLTYQQVLDRAEYLGSGLLHKGCKPSPDQFIGIFAQNRPEWIISEFACYTYSMVAVPLYDTLGPEAIVYIVNKADMSTVICDKPEKAEIILANCEGGKTPDVKTIILMDPFGDELRERGAKLGVEIMSLQEIELLLSMNLHSSLCPCVGNPKGAMLTHQNVVSNAAGFSKSMESTFDCLPSDISLSYLPLAHMFERVVQAVIYSGGAKVGFFQGDIRLLMDDMRELKPTVFPVVPRLLNRLYDKIQSGAQTKFKKLLLNFAASRKHAEVKQGILRNTSIWDKIIFKKVQDTMGGKVRLMVTAAAPISPSVLSFLRSALGCPIFEAYGQTECTGGCTFSVPGDWTTGPSRCWAFRMLYWLMTYFGSFQGGPVLIDFCDGFNGYVTSITSGTLKIIDRKKNIFKLAQGEYIAPEKIENVYIRSAPVAQVYVHGDSLQSFLVGVVVPDPEVMPEFSAKLGIKASYEEICKHSEVKKAILDDLVKLGKGAGLKSFEQVKDIFLHPEMFTIENGLLTPTLKAKRAELAKYFRSQLDALYADAQG
uniref:long-chain-fatty-acid--CoA ligase n=1 Tax=Sphenodon punctatus TaxID=8508 RepID=A0A8D0GIT2_SPHPU